MYRHIFILFIWHWNCSKTFKIHLHQNLLQWNVLQTSLKIYWFCYLIYFSNCNSKFFWIGAEQTTELVLIKWCIVIGPSLDVEKRRHDVDVSSIRISGLKLIAFTVNIRTMICVSVYWPIFLNKIKVSDLNTLVNS